MINISSYIASGFTIILGLALINSGDYLFGCIGVFIGIIDLLLLD